MPPRSRQVVARNVVAVVTGLGVAGLSVGCSENPRPGDSSSSSASSSSPPTLRASGAPRAAPVAPQATVEGAVVPPATTLESRRPAADEPIALVNGQTITREQLVRPLIEAYGLNLLLQIIQLDLARQDAAKQGLAVTPADIRHERMVMLKGAFPDAEASDYEQLLAQLLKQQNIPASQFEIILETNAYLRKIAEPLCKDKISEENIKQAFDLQYGTTVKIRDIKVANLSEANEVKRRLAAGADFAEVARQLSRDPQTAPLGGDWPAFAASSTRVSDVIKEQAFGLKIGEVSDVLNTEGAYHIIKVEQRNAPRLAKLDDDTRAYLRNVLMEKLVQDAIKGLRAQLAQQALQPNILEIRDPELRRQFEQRLAEYKAAQQEQERARTAEQLNRLYPATRAMNPTTRPGFAPATAPVAVPVAPPTTRPTPEAPQRPPATTSGAGAR